MQFRATIGTAGWRETGTQGNGLKTDRLLRRGNRIKSHLLRLPVWLYYCVEGDFVIEKRESGRAKACWKCTCYLSVLVRVKVEVDDRHKGIPLERT